MDKLQWFKFAPSDWMMGKIQRCPEVTQARFLRLSCLYWNKECNLSYEDAEIEIDQEHLDVLIKKKIIKVIDGFIFLDFLDEQMEGIIETSTKRREAVNKRWAKTKQKDTKEIQTDTSVLQNDTDKSRVDESRVDKNNQSKIDFDSLLLLINLHTKRNFKVINSTIQAKYKARLKDGYTKEDIRNTIINSVQDQFHKDNNYKYLTPEYFSRASTIDKFNQQIKVQSNIIHDSSPVN